MMERVVFVYWTILVFALSVSGYSSYWQGSFKGNIPIGPEFTG